MRTMKQDKRSARRRVVRILPTALFALPLFWFCTDAFSNDAAGVPIELSESERVSSKIDSRAHSKEKNPRPFLHGAGATETIEPSASDDGLAADDGFEASNAASEDQIPSATSSSGFGGAESDHEIRVNSTERGDPSDCGRNDPDAVKNRNACRNESVYALESAEAPQRHSGSIGGEASSPSDESENAGETSERAEEPSPQEAEAQPFFSRIAASASWREWHEQAEKFCNGYLLHWLLLGILLLFGSIGICLILAGKLFAFDAAKDILPSLVLSIPFFAFSAPLVANQAGNHELDFLMPYFVGCTALIFLYELSTSGSANPGKFWALSFVIPAKLMIGSYLLILGLCVLFQIKQLASGKIKNSSLQDFIRTGALAGVSFATVSAIKKMTRKFMNDG